MTEKTDPRSWAEGRIPRVPAPGPGGLVDANSYLGEWPSRRLNGSPPPSGAELVAQRLRLMDRLGIRWAAVSRLEGVWLKDCATANAELHALLAGRLDRFFPVYTLNPTFPAWHEHLQRCVDDYGLAAGQGAVRFHPGHHGYRLDDRRLDGCLARLAGMDVLVVLPVQLDDARVHQPAMRVPDLAPDDVAAFVGRWPQVRWVIGSAVHAQILAIGRQFAPEARVWFDLSRVQGPIDGIRILCEQVGVQRLLFGTNLPLHVAESAIMELADARLLPEDDAAVRYGNAERALGIA